MKLLLLRIRKLFIALKSKAGISALASQGVLAAVEHLPVLKLKKFACIVDIGANRGQFTLAALMSNPTCKIIAFEPLNEAADVYEALFLSYSNVKLFRHAVGSTTGNNVIHISKKNDSSSLLPIGDNQVRLFPNSNEVDSREVSVMPLDSAMSSRDIEHPSLLKIDVQGYELEVLKGCQDILSSFDNIYCECSFFELYTGQPRTYEVIDYLSQCGFYLDGIFNPSYDDSGICVQADFLFARRP